MKKSAFLFMLCIFLILPGCGEVGKTPQQPVLEFTDRAVTLFFGETELRGKLSRTLQQVCTFEITEGTLAGMKITDSPSGAVIAYGGISEDAACARNGPVFTVFSALNVAAEGLTFSENSFVGTLPDGAVFSVVTDGFGTVQKLILSGMILDFEP